MADRIVVMNHGVIEQVGTPTRDLPPIRNRRSSPTSSAMNLQFPGARRADRVRVGRLEHPPGLRAARAADGSAVTVVIRPSRHRRRMARARGAARRNASRRRGQRDGVPRRLLALRASGAAARGTPSSSPTSRSTPCAGSASSRAAATAGRAAARARCASSRGTAECRGDPRPTRPAARPASSPVSARRLAACAGSMVVIGALSAPQRLRCRSMRCCRNRSRPTSFDLGQIEVPGQTTPDWQPLGSDPGAGRAR